MDAVQGACGDPGACGLIGHMVLESGAGACVLGYVVKGQHVLALEYYIVLPQSLWRQYLDVVQSLGGWLVGYLWGYKSQGLEPKFKSACASRVGRSGLAVIQPRFSEVRHQNSSARPGESGEPLPDR
jgi:hypothetical protein